MDGVPWSQQFLSEQLAAFPDQVQGSRGALCETGKPYEEFEVSYISRPGDVIEVRAIIAEEMYAKLEEYFFGKKGRIYWHTRVQWKEDSPRPRWVSIRVFCKVHRAMEPVPIPAM